MKQFSKRLSLVLVCSMLFACSNKAPDLNENNISLNPVISGEYGYYLPYETNKTSTIHNNYQSSKNENLSLGKQALKLAKKHFDPNKLLVQEGNVISASELERYDANYRGLGLLRYKTSYNPEGLNPERGSAVDNGYGLQMYNPIIVADVHEIDYVNNAGEYQGFTFVIVLNSKVRYYEAQLDESGNPITKNDEIQLAEEGKITTMSDEQLFTYGSVEAGQRLVNYLRNNHPEVSNLPIHVALYKASVADSNLPGVFLGESLVQDRSASYSELNQEWVFVPSTRASELNGIVTSQYTSLKNALFEHFPNDVGMYGLAYFENQMIQELKIEVNIQAKTYVESSSMIQYLVALCETFTDSTFALQIQVLSDSKVIAVLNRDINTSNVTVTML